MRAAASDAVATRQRPIGPAGRVARITVGLALIGLALFWWEPGWLDAVLGLLVMPALAVGLLAARARRSATQLRATGPAGHALSLVIAIPLLVVPATAGGAAIFYGLSMLLAGTRGIGGCEITALSNLALSRDDQLGCAVFAPVDIAEAALGNAQPTGSRG
jgi:hypothetical protein